jgi:hypothetical protein
MQKIIFFITFLVVILKGVTTAQNPYESIGKPMPKGKILTLTNGKYPEVIENDTVVRIGSVMFNTVTGEVVAFLTKDTLHTEYSLEPDVVSRWLSPDPLAEKYLQWSPYVYGTNNPIRFIDPDGRQNEDIIIKSRTLRTTHDGNKLQTEIVDGPSVKYNSDGSLTDLSTGKAYTGNDCYILSTQAELNSHRATNAQGEEITKALTESGFTAVISNVDKQMGADGKPIAGSYSRPDGSSGSFTKYAPNEDKLAQKKFTVEEVLGHELKHDYNMKKGNWSESNKTRTAPDAQNRTNKMEEVDATNYQNVVRAAQGSPLLNTYQGVDISPYIVPPSQYKLDKTNKRQ